MFNITIENMLRITIKFENIIEKDNKFQNNMNLEIAETPSFPPNLDKNSY